MNELSRTLLDCHSITRSFMSEPTPPGTILGTSEVSHAAVVEMDPSGDRHVRSGGRCRDLRTPMAASSLRPSFCLHGNPNTTTSAEWIRHTHRPSHQSIRIVVSLQSKLQQVPPAMDRDRRYVCSNSGHVKLRAIARRLPCNKSHEIPRYATYIVLGERQVLTTTQQTA